jgi:hypothetical protein
VDFYDSAAGLIPQHFTTDARSLLDAKYLQIIILSCVYTKYFEKGQREKDFLFSFFPFLFFPTTNIFDRNLV